MGLREEIKAASRMARIRMGQEAFEWCDIPSLEGIRVAMVPLNETEEQQGLIAAANLGVPDNLVGLQARQRAGQVHDVWMACRMPDNLSHYVWDTPEAMMDEIEPTDLDYMFEFLVTLQDYASPSLAKLSDKEVEELKKAFVAIDWKDLTGKQANALVLALSRLLPGELQDSIFSSSFTQNLTGKTESGESTPDALTSSGRLTVRSAENQ